MKKRILTLGGSYFQADFVEDAISLGYDVVCVDKDSQCFVNQQIPAVFRHIDFGNIEILRDYLKDNIFDAVISPANEFGNLIASKLSEDFGFNYNSFDTVNCSIDKGLLKKKMKDANINHPLSFSLQNLDEIVFPVVVKPSNSSAGRGVNLVKSLNELEESVEDANKYLKEGGTILVEEYIKGEQYSIETISANGKHYIAGITKETTSGIPQFIERSHYTNSEIFSKKNLLNDYINQLLDTLGVKFGPCHIEILIDERGKIFPIDVATRSGGLRSKLLKYAKSSYFNKLIMDSYVDGIINEEDIIVPQLTSTVSFLMYPRDLEKYLLAKKENNLVEEYFYSRGPEVFPCNIMHAFGYFFAAYPTTEFRYML